MTRILTGADMTQALSLDEQQLRERCIEIAARADPYGAVALATEYLAFIHGDTDRTPREKINDALEQAGVS